MTSIIDCAGTHHNCKLTVNPEVGDGDTYLQITGKEPHIRVPRAQLLAALGFDKLGCGCDQADENLKAALARAEKAEATLAALAKMKFKDSDISLKAHRRIIAVMNGKPDPGKFELPTEAGAVIFATVDETGQEHELHLYGDGKWRDDTETWYWPKDVLTDFTDHRLPGSDE